MGRKKRSPYGAEKELPVGPVLRTEWPTAIYARLSIENSNKDDGGESIEGQVEICREYVKEHSYLDLKDVYIDNGWTGTNTDRPAFQNLLSDIYSGRIKALVVKDFSRFSRDYIEAGDLLENVFPALGIRFISVIDQYDSCETDGSAHSLLLPLKNLINSFYSKDISRKVTSAFRTRQEAGTYHQPCVPYGYRWSSVLENRFEPDPETAEVVLRIFTLRSQETPYRTIATKLQNEGIPSPGKLRFLRGQVKSKNYEASQWTPAMVKRILRNPVYLGHLVHGRNVSQFPGQKNRPKMPESEWRYQYDAHEPLVSQELFNRCAELDKESSEARRTLLDSKREEREADQPLFFGLLFCGECGRKMYYSRNRYKPGVLEGSYYCWGRDKNLCHDSHNVTQATLKTIIWRSISDQFELFMNCEKLFSLLENGLTTSALEDCRREILGLSEQLHDRSEKRSHLYEDYAEGLLSAEDYQYMKQRYDDEYLNITCRLDSLQGKQAKLKRTLSRDNQWYVHMKEYECASELTRELLDTLIEKIVVFRRPEEGLRVEIHYKYACDRDVVLSTYEEVVEGEGQ